MKVLIVESEAELGRIWARHLERQGAEVRLATSQESAIDELNCEMFDVIVLDVLLDDGNALMIADYALFRRPESRVIFVTNTSFFSDGSIFRICANACAFVQRESPPEDIAAMVDHYGSAVMAAAGATPGP